MKPRRSPKVTPLLVGVLGFLSMGSSFAMDMYLPALPDVTEELSATPVLVQVTLTAFFVGQAFGQFVLGPLSDRFGRWWPLLIGSALFVAASAAAAGAPSIEMLIAFRVVQGFGSAAGPVIGRAVVADLASGAQAARLFGLLMMLFGFAPVVAPILGGPLTELGGWRATMLGVLVLGVLALLSVFAVPESLPIERRRAVRLLAIGTEIRELAHNRVYLFSVMILTASFGVITAWLAASSFVLQGHFGLTPTQYSLAFAAIFAGYLLAGVVNTILLRWFAPTRILTGSVWVLAGSVALLVLLESTGLIGFWGLMALVTLSCSAIAPLAANATAVGLGTVPSNRAGSASALMGAAETLIPAVLIPVLGLFGESPVPLIVAFAIAAAACVGLELTRPRVPASGTYE